MPQRLTWLALFVLAVLSFAAPGHAADDADAIVGVIRSAYVDGIWRHRDVAAVQAGFHPAFVMQRLQADGTVQSTTLDQWLERLKLDGKPNPQKVEAEIRVLDRDGDAATARVDLKVDGKPRFTDYMSLYRFEDGWKIVAKIFHSHG